MFCLFDVVLFYAGIEIESLSAEGVNKFGEGWGDIRSRHVISNTHTDFPRGRIIIIFAFVVRLKKQKKDIGVGLMFSFPEKFRIITRAWKVSSIALTLGNCL